MSYVIVLNLSVSVLLSRARAVSDPGAPTHLRRHALGRSLETVNPGVNLLWIGQGCPGKGGKEKDEV